ncbi:hypothetical protein AKJ16_DCAP00805 [Drosera capensis]
MEHFVIQILYILLPYVKCFKRTLFLESKLVLQLGCPSLE